VLTHSKQFDSPTRNKPVAEFIDSFRERGQRDGMKRENYLPIDILRTENLPPQSSFEKNALRGAP
jgi:hypothetical protein